MRTFVLTGATGFLGRTIAQQLTAQGDRVIALVRPASRRESLVALACCECISYGGFGSTSVSNFAFNRGPINDEITNLGAQLRERSPAVFIHLGWGGTASHERNTTAQVTLNLPTTIATVQLAAAAGCHQWIGIGSQTEYGHPDTQTDERSPTLPTSLYGQAKLAACWAGLGMCQTLGLTGTWARIYQLYGPGDAPQRLIPYVIRELLAGRSPQVTECRQFWDYLHVNDAAAAIISLANGQHGGIFNVGSGEAVLLKTVIEQIRAQTNPAISPSYGAIAYPADQVMHLQANITRLQTFTGWKPEIDLGSGIQQTVDWFRSQA